MWAPEDAQLGMLTRPPCGCPQSGHCTAWAQCSMDTSPHPSPHPWAHLQVRGREARHLCVPLAQQVVVGAEVDRQVAGVEAGGRVEGEGEGGL